MSTLEKKPPEQLRKKITGKTLVVLTLVVVLFGFLIFCLFITPRLAEKGDRLQISYEGQPRLGSKTAPIKIMEFADFKCPACKSFHHKVLPRIKKEFIDTGKVQIYFTNFQYMGDDSVLAGMIGESIYHQNNDLFWSYYDFMYMNQKSEHENWINPDTLFELMERQIPDVDLNRVISDLDNNTYEKIVLNENMLARKMKIVEVPAIFVNGKKIRNPLDYNEIKRAIKEEQMR